MKTITLAAAIMLAGATAAGAADLGRGSSTGSIKDVPSTQAWTGPYIGIHGGYALSSHEANIDVNGTNVFDLNGLSGRGGTVGVIVGYDHVVIPQLLIGAYGEYNITDLDTTLTVGPKASMFDGRLHQGDTWVIGGRIGTFVRGTLVFLNAGYAHSDFTASAVGLGSLTKEADGVVVGGGVELPLGAGWFANVKYDHTFYQDVKWGDVTFGENTASISSTPDVDRIMLGVSWKFAR
jgi:outer membrane immunogenic protein